MKCVDTYDMQSMIGHTDKHSVHPVQSSVTCGIWVSGSNLGLQLGMLQLRIAYNRVDYTIHHPSD